MRTNVQLRQLLSQSMPMLSERLANLHEIGTVLLEVCDGPLSISKLVLSCQKYDGLFANCVRQCGHSCQVHGARQR